MPYHVQTRRYAIDNWHQLTSARSNTDPTLRIKVSDFISSTVLQGVRVSVIHPQYGVLFAALTRADGRIIPEDARGLSTQDILDALQQLGFYVTFKQTVQVTPETRVFLESAKNVGYTHIRRALLLYKSASTSAKVTRPIIICFNENTHPEFLKQFLKPLPFLDSNVMRVSPNSNPTLDFSWLFDIPLEINSVLTDNL